MPDLGNEATPESGTKVSDTPQPEANEQTERSEALDANFNSMVDSGFNEIFPQLGNEAPPQEEEKEEVDGNVDDTPEESEVDDNIGNSDAATLAKRISDKDAMISRQANEIGELRKEVKEVLSLVKEKEASSEPQQEQQTQEEILLNASEREIAEALVEDSKGDISIEDALSQARIIKGSLTAAENLVKRRMAPILKQHEDSVLKSNFDKSEEAFMAEHTEFAVRKPIIEKIIADTYPNGISAELNPYVESKQFFKILNVAYVAAGKIMASAQGKESTDERKRVISQRNVNTSTAGAGKPPAAPKKKLSAYELEIEKAVSVFDKK